MSVPDIEKFLFDERSRPLAFLCSSARSVNDMITWIEGNTNGEQFVQIFRHDEAIIDLLLPAYLNAVERYKWGMLRTKDLAHEMLALVARTFDMHKAISSFGADSNSEFIAFAAGGPIFEKFSKENSVKAIKEYKLALSEDAASEINSFLLMQK